MIDTKGTFIKAKAKNRGHVVIQNILNFRKISKGTVFPNSISDKSDDGFEYSRHGTIDNYNHNDRRYPSPNRQTSCRYDTASER